MAIRERAAVQPRLIAELAFASTHLDALVHAIRSLDSRLTSGLVEGRVDDGSWVARLEARDTESFTAMLGGYIRDTGWSFEDVLVRLPSPAMYVLTGGFSVWGNKALLINSAYLLHGNKIFQRLLPRKE